jgi:lysozyme
MKLSSNGRSLIKGFEGLSLKAYPDPPGDPQGRHSIGYGHSGAKPGDVITRGEADELFDRDLVKYETSVSFTTPDASQQQFDAMVSLAYNVGAGGFGSSTVARLHNMGDISGAADAFRMWNKAAGKVHQGLVARREKERGVYLYGYTSPTHYHEPAPNYSSPTWPESVAPAEPATAEKRVTAPFIAAVFGVIGWVVWSLTHR